MRFGRTLWVLCVFGGLNGDRLPLDERGTRVWLEGGQAAIRLPLPAGLPVGATVTARWLTPAGTSYGEHQLPVPPGANVADFRTDSPWHQAAAAKKLSEVPWHRLEYRVATTAGEMAAGIVGLSVMQSNLFDLEVNASSSVSQGDEHSMLVRAFHPQTRRAVPGVKLRLIESTEVFAQGTTDPRGWATLTFRVPARQDDWTPKLEGALGDVVIPVELDFDIDEGSTVQLQFDKPLYQPGQTIRARAVLFARNGRAAAGREAEVEIDDPEGNTLLELKRTANRFGVIAFDVPLGEKARTGHYRVKISTGGTDDRGWHGVEVSRYELPTMRIHAEANQRFYSPGERATIKARAELIDGSPLPRAKIRMVKQEDAGDEAEGVRGETNANGEFTARWTPDELLDERPWQHGERERVVPMLVTVTDPATGRTAEQAVELRFVAKPMVVSVVRAELLQAGVPRDFFVYTGYVDGTPALTTVDVFEVSPRFGKVLRTSVQTNPRGLALVPGFQLRAPKDAVLRVQARDAIERRGEIDVHMWQGAPPVEIAPLRTLHRAGDALEADVRGAAGSGEVEFSVWADQRLVHMEAVRMKHGRARVRVPYRPEFRNEVVLSARPLGDELGDEPAICRTVLYPEQRTLALAIDTDKSVYRPGESAKALFRAGESAALGVAITDAAVDKVAAQRRRGARWSWSGYYSTEYPESLAQNLRLSKADSDEDQLTAAFLAASRYTSEPARMHQQGAFFAKASAAMFAGTLEAPLKQLTKTAEDHFAEHAEYPAHMGDHLDPWRRTLRLTHASEGALRSAKLWSTGADGQAGNGDDFEVWSAKWSHFERHARRLRQVEPAIARALPRSPAALRGALLKLGLDSSEWKDAWGRPYEWLYRRDYAPGTWHYVTVRPSPADAARTVESGVRVKHVFQLMSSGPNVQDRWDDFAAHTLTVAEDTTLEQMPFVRKSGRPELGGGGIQGSVTDTSGAAIPTAKVEAWNQRTAEHYETVTDGMGVYVLGALPADLYTIQFDVAGFQRYRTERVVVVRNEWTKLDAELRVGTISETVMVTAEAMPLMTSVASGVMSASKGSALTAVRLRRHFPETLLWAPLLETDADGRLAVPFTLADSITTWKITAWASTVDGRMAEATREIRATQSLYIEFNPPQVLTQGDRVELPATLRNLTDRSETLNVGLTTNKGLGSDQRRLTSALKARSSETLFFPITAQSGVAESTVRVEASHASLGDAVEKPVRLRPLGREVHQSVSELVDGSTMLTLELPKQMLAGSATLELAVYPSVLAHLEGALRGMLTRPYGCGEQTISTTYPHVMMLQYLRGRSEPGDEAARAAAVENLKAGLQRLAGYRTGEGGVAYWHGQATDVALTAYAVGLWREAREFVTVEAEWLTAAERYLITLKGDNPLVSRMLGREPVNLTSDDPSVLAHAVLSGGTSAARREALSRLMVTRAKTARTLFYSWGPPAELEGDALAVQALRHAQDWPEVDQQAIAAAIRRHAAPLMKTRDRWGAWYNTQTTRQVLRALIALDSPHQGKTTAFAVRLNGQALHFPAGTGKAMRRLDLLPYVNGPGTYRVQFQMEDGSAPFVAQLAATYYVEWNAAAPSQNELTLEVNHSTLAPAVSESVTTSVRFARKRWGGMLTAEVGLPPGATVDVASLTQPEIDRYEIQPDRVVFYVWPWNTEPREIRFRWRPRFRMEAHSAPSSLVDFYNPEARAETPPARFEVR